MSQVQDPPRAVTFGEENAAALGEDLGRAPFEAWAADLRATAREIEHLLGHLASWVRPEKRKVPFPLAPLPGRGGPGAARRGAGDRVF